MTEHKKPPRIVPKLKNAHVNDVWKITRSREPNDVGMFTIKAVTKDEEQGFTYPAGKGYVDELFKPDEITVYVLGRIQGPKFYIDYILRDTDRPKW